MEELRGPNIQVILHIKEGVGFGFLRAPFIVSGSLNGYLLETDPIVPCHAPVFDAELVWEADKRKFRSLRVQNVPIKVEVFSVGTQGRKDKIGYFLLSLLGAQPCPSNKIVDIKHTWHRILGLKAEGKCCQPQLLVSLSIHDRTKTFTRRNELRMFHSNEVAYPANVEHPTVNSLDLTLKEYLDENKRTVISPDLQPRLLCDEGLIQIGDGKDLFVLSFVVGSVENLDLLLPEGAPKEGVSCYATYSVFTHDIQTDRVNSVRGGEGSVARFNQRTSLRLRGSLPALGRYLRHCPLLLARLYAHHAHAGICSVDLRKLIPTEDLYEFTNNYCDMNSGLSIHERCFIVRCEGGGREMEEVRGERRPYIDVEVTLRYAGEYVEKTKKPAKLSSQSVTQLERGRGPIESQTVVGCRSGSCTNIAGDLGPAYTHMGICNTDRYRNAAGDAMIPTNEIADLIKKMYETFQESQEKLLAAKLRPTTSDMQVQCEPEAKKETEHSSPKEATQTDSTPKEVRKTDVTLKGERKMDATAMGLEDATPRGNPEAYPRGNLDPTPRGRLDEIPIKLETSRSDTHLRLNYNEQVKRAIPALERNELLQRCVEELEDWKEKQQELFKLALKRKEEYHLELLAREWSKKQVDLECKLSKGIEQCRHLAADLSRATDDFRLKGFRNTEREKKLAEAKKALETHYTAKYQELRLASQKMEDDMQHQLTLKDLRIQELEAKVHMLEKQIQELQNNLDSNEKANESKYSGLTKDQTASLIQELRCLEEKLESAVQSKAFFKEQWGRAVRELHLSKLHTRRQMLTQLRQDRRQLGEMGLDTNQDERNLSRSQVDLNRLKDDFYVDLLANTPGLEAASMISSIGPEGMEILDDVKNKKPINAKLNELITQRDQLIQQDSPDEGLLKELNREIRNMLLNCGTT